MSSQKEKLTSKPTYLLSVNILPWQDVFCTGEPTLEKKKKKKKKIPHWKPSQGTFFRKWAECPQKCSKTHIQTENGDGSTRNFKQARCSIMVFRREKWQDGASCDKNSEESLHRPQVELGGSLACPLRRECPSTAAENTTRFCGKPDHFIKHQKKEKKEGQGD